jgi:hypothetical protein
MKSNRLFLGISIVILCLGIALLIWGFIESKNAVILIEWSTASELDTVGFNLYRSDNSDGPFEMVNASLVPSSSDPLTGGEYKYEDTSVTPGKTYYYRLEDVEVNGATTQHGPIEVKAESEGRSALISGVSLIIFSIIGIIILVLPKKNPPLMANEG